MPTDFLAAARVLSPELSELRRAFHRRPELGNREFETARRIEDSLNGRGIPTRRLLDTAVIGRLEGALPGPTVALRADDVDRVVLLGAHRAASSRSRGPKASGRTSSIVRMPLTVSSSMPGIACSKSS